ncbi:MAG TPA: hypothetical protein VJ739_09870, partial [Gemmataceae bacterium]|nr:hypothetical protein [Gemmataceae bacterium]
MPPPLASSRVPPVGAGMAALVLGVIGLILSPLPVLGVPVSGLALALGIAGTLADWRGGGARLRSALVGVGLSALALG